MIVSQQQSHSNEEGDNEDLTSLIAVFPNQGTLAPGETAQLYFKFSPRLHKSSIGWKSTDEIAPRKDYALFINIEAVGVVDRSDEGLFKHGTHSHIEKITCKRAITEASAY